jgi:hypothetical protein
MAVRYDIKRRAATNSRFAKAGISCYYDSKVLNSNFVHLMKLNAKNPRLRKAENVGSHQKKQKTNRQDNL